MFKTIKKYTTMNLFELIWGSLFVGAAFAVFIFAFSIATMGD